jgi:hypothetical protein
MFGGMILEDIAWLDFDRIHNKGNILVIDNDSNRREGINSQLANSNSNSSTACPRSQTNG